MKKIALGVILATQLFGAEPITMGAAIGDLKFNTKDLVMYKNHAAGFAGLLWLIKNNKDDIKYINDTKQGQVSDALDEAKEFAKSKKESFYAIDNIVHQVIVTENKVIVTTDYNVLAFD